jgi:hypothetical protein
MTDENRIDKVLTVDDAKIFHARGVLAFLTFSPPFLYDASSVEVQCNNPVPVYGVGGEHVGYGTVSLESGKLTAELALRYDSQERLFLQNYSPPLYMRPIGTLEPTLALCIEGILLQTTPPYPGLPSLTELPIGR